MGNIYPRLVLQTPISEECHPSASTGLRVARYAQLSAGAVRYVVRVTRDALRNRRLGLGLGLGLGLDLQEDKKMSALGAVFHGKLYLEMQIIIMFYYLLSFRLIIYFKENVIINIQTHRFWTIALVGNNTGYSVSPPATSSQYQGQGCV